jgi:DNA repair protein RecO (recombination protein O)
VRREPRNSPAIVLRQIDYGESDLIVSLLTSELGVLRGYARGARKSIKRFGPALEPFSQIEIRWQPGRGELLTLLDADIVSTRQGLRLSLTNLALAAYAVEVLEMLLQEGEEQSELYSLLQGYLDYLSVQGDPALARLLFELRLVQHLGYIPHLLHCSECFALFGGGDIAFDPVRGGSLCDTCSDGKSPLSVGLGTLGSLSRSLQTPIGLFDGFHFGSRTLKEGAIMMALILESVLPKMPKSLRFLQQTTGFNEP